MDETYIKAKGKWVYVYRAIDKHGDTIDFMLSAARDETIATIFFDSAIGNNGLPEKVVMDKSGASFAGLINTNIRLFLAGCWWLLIDILQVRYLNNIIEQDHRLIKRLTVSMMGFKALHLAQATIAGIETAH